MIDLDYIEFCARCSQPIMLGEVAADVGQQYKATTILAHLAEMAGIPGLRIFLKEAPIKQFVQEMGIDTEAIPRLTRDQLAELWLRLERYDKPLLRIQRVSPDNGPLRIITASEFFQRILRLHRQHERAKGH